MKPFPIPLLALLLLVSLALLGSHCKCKEKMVAEPEVVVPDPEIYTKYPTDRADVPPPPPEPWWTLEPDSLNECESILFEYIKQLYPIVVDTFYYYNMLAFTGDTLPSDQAWQNTMPFNPLLLFFEKFTLENLRIYPPQYSFTNCVGQIDSNLILQTWGPPSCRGENKRKRQVNYTYYVKNKFRTGPCPDIASVFNHPLNYFCNSNHFLQCLVITVRFSKEDGSLFHIFMGPGR